MRTFTALIFCLYMLVPTFAIAQQDESCDANPRWLLVTVLAAADNFVDEKAKEVARAEHLRHVDRCIINSISTATDGSDPRISSEILMVFNSEPVEESLWVRLWLKESLQDICRAMRDCEDTTSRP